MNRISNGKNHSTEPAKKSGDDRNMSNLSNLPVTEVNGIGAQRAGHLAQLGIHSLMDLFEYMPYRYEDYRVREISTAPHGETITVKGRVTGVPNVRWYGRKKSRLAVNIQTDGVWLTAVWFNQHYLKNKLTPEREVILVGKWDRQRLQLTVKRTLFSKKEQEALIGRLEPVYSVAGPVRVEWLRKTIRQAFTQFGHRIEEILPRELMTRYKLMKRKEAMFVMHFPKNETEGHQARRRLAYEELFLFQLKLQIVRHYRKKRSNGIAKEVPRGELRRFISALPFSLTVAQRNVLQEALRDLSQPTAMHRLLQGDVGSGKTVVAATLLYANHMSGFQGALMAPTEILAEQHAQTLRRLLEPFDVQTALLVGSMTAREKREVIGMLQMGLVHVVIGTHALIQETVHFHRLGLVVTDEQHRFGVKQRALLREKGEEPDVLFMTATPIPRTLAITAFGDMDVSTIDQMPTGRKPVKTVWVKEHMLDRVWQFIREQLEEGNQAYVICPLIAESEKLDLQNAQDVFEQIKPVMEPYQTGLLHGKLPQKEKEEVMARFVSGQTNVLVSTTVVEVGVDVPNATVMVIYDAERFGLAQLHQLRGRVGRGEKPSHCILVADPKSEIGKERMRIMTETDDGFTVAQKDLEIRGPGDFFGVKQSGLPEFKVADVVQDYRILEVARTDAAKLVNSRAFWQESRFMPLRRWLEQDEKLFNKNFD